MKVLAADPGKHTVNDQQFAMQSCGVPVDFLGVHFSALLFKTGKTLQDRLRNRRRVDTFPGIGEDAHANAAFEGVGDGFLDDRVGDKVGIFNVNGLCSAVEGFYGYDVYVVVSQRLMIDDHGKTLAEGSLVSKRTVPYLLTARLFIPFTDKGHLRLVDHRASHVDVRVTPVTPGIGVEVTVLIPDIQAAHDHLLVVNNHDLAVHAEVRVARVMEADDFNRRLGERGIFLEVAKHVMEAEFLGHVAVHDDFDFKVAPGAETLKFRVNQPVGKIPARAIVIESPREDIDGLLRFVDQLFAFRERSRTVEENVHLISGGPLKTKRFCKESGHFVPVTVLVH